jgi:prepilin peptidase CpaA
MSTTVHLAWIAQVNLGVLLAAAVATDLKAGKIPNRLVLWGLALAVAWHATALTAGQAPLAGSGPGAWLTGALAGAAALLPLYLMRACGAGDVKLMAMVGAFVGVPMALSAALYTLVAGGVLSIAVMALRGVAGQTLSNIRFLLTDWGLRATTGQGLRLAPLSTTAARLPYAVAIAAGTFIALWRPLPLLE